MTTTKTWARFFDGHAPEYNENCFTKNTLAEVDFLEKELKLAPGAAILDVGCGTGRHAVELARRGYRVTGLDLSAGMLEQAKASATAAGVDVTWVQSDATHFALDPVFDVVIGLCEGAFGLLGSGDDPLGQPQAILRNVYAAMKPGAKCLFTVLNGYALARKYSQEDVEQGRFDPLGLTEVSDCEAGVEDTVLRERGFVPTELTLLFREAGLSVLGLWGGTAGDWGKRSINLDEIEIMVLGQKAEKKV